MKILGFCGGEFVHNCEIGSREPTPHKYWARRGATCQRLLYILVRLTGKRISNLNERKIKSILSNDEKSLLLKLLGILL